MPRTSYKKWRSIQDFGIRPGLVLPAWKEGDQVEVIGTAVRGRIVRCTSLDWTWWEVEYSPGKFVETHANNLRAVPRSTCPVHPGAVGQVEGCLGCRA